MELSIIIPVYNVEKYLRRCIRSILKQSYKDYEIILVDDGSTDSSGRQCETICEEYPLITRVIHKVNGGLSSARNAGLTVARGHYIMFLDSDDWIEKDCLEKFSRLFKENYDLIMGRSWSIDQWGHKVPKLPYKVPIGLYDKHIYVKKCLCNENDISFCCPFYLYRREYIEKSKLSFYNGIIHEDELWMPIALLKAETIYVSDIFFYYHFIRTGSIMHSPNYKYSASCTLKICRILDKEFTMYSRDEVRWMRNRLAMLFLRAIPQLKDSSIYIKNFKRDFPLKNAVTARQVIKSTLYYLSPGLYCKIIRKFRGYHK